MANETTDFFAELFRTLLRLFQLMVYGALGIAGLFLKLISEFMQDGPRKK